ncbi:MAG: hypothetical protein AAF541_01710 [Pseudomonadota bacterium]
MYESPTQPQSIGGVLDDGFKIYRACLKDVFLVCVLGGLITAIPSSFLATGIEDPASFSWSGFAVIYLVVMLLSTAVMIPVLMKIAGLVKGQPISWSQAFARIISAVIPALICLVLYILAVGIGSLLLLVPGIILSISLVLSVYMVIVDGAGPIDALKQSHNLVWGNWWRTMVIFTVVGIIGIVVVMLLSTVLILITGVPEPGESTFVADFVLSPLMTGLISPLFYAFILAVMNDLKLRKEGGDLEDRITSLDDD